MKRHSSIYWCIVFFYSFIFLPNKLLALLDLEENAQEFVLETKQITIPGYPDAFNPSIIRWNGKLLMSFRILPHPSLSKFDSWIGLIFLDEAFEPIGKPQFFNTKNEYYRSEDARLILVGDQLWMAYSDNKDPKITRGGFRIYLAKVLYDGQKFSLEQNERLTHFEGESQLRREKNWSPFDYEGHLLLAYSLLPHRIIRPLLGGTEKCENFSSTKAVISWDWGELRGGTPGLLIDGQYLAFFHSSKDLASVHSEGKATAHYFMGAYTFSSQPPFEITGISHEPIVGKGFYKGKTYVPYWKPVNVVFPGGFIQDEAFIWVAYGRQDREMWIAKLDKQQLLQSLVPVTTIRSINRQ